MKVFRGDELLNAGEIAALTAHLPRLPETLSPAQRDALSQLFNCYTLSRDPAVAAATKELWDRILSGPLGAHWHKE